MYNNHYYNEIMVKERQKQLLAEADRLRLIRAAKSTRTQNGNRIFGSISRFIKSFGTYFQKNHKPSTCGCRQV
jgi:hypothetical protein